MYSSPYFGIPGFWLCHVAFQVVGGSLALVPSHLLFQMEPAETWCLSPVFGVTESLSVSLQCRSRDRPVELELLSTQTWMTVQMELLSTPMMSLLVPGSDLLAAWVSRK